MKSILHKLYIVLSPFVLFTGCYPDYLGGHYVEDGRGEKAVLTGVVESAIEPDRHWNAGDRISVTTSYYDQSALNRIYTCAEDGLSFTPDTEIPIYIKGTGLLLAYYPVQGADGAEPEALSLSTSDQSHLTSYLFAREPIKLGDSAVRLRFHHILGQLQVNITKLLPGEEIKTVVLKGFYHGASVDPYSWDIYLGNNTPQDYMLTSSEPLTSFRLALIPQTVAAEAAEPAYLSLVGTLRTYDVALGNVLIESDRLLTASVDISGAAPTVDFTYDEAVWTDYEEKFKNSITFGSDTAQWADSGKGGDITSH